MKTKIMFYTIIIVLLMASVLFAKVWRVNNIDGVDADFKDIQEAVDAAQSGDTLYVEGSGKKYGSFTIGGLLPASQKKLYIYGPGYFLEHNPNTQANLQPASIDYITFETGSEGSYIAGLNLYSVSIKVNNITIKRNKIYGISLSSNASNIIIRQNYIHYSLAMSSDNLHTVVTNNIIASIGSSSSDSPITVSNNIIYGGISLGISQEINYSFFQL